MAVNKLLCPQGPLEPLVRHQRRDAGVLAEACDEHAGGPAECAQVPRQRKAPDGPLQINGQRPRWLSHLLIAEGLIIPIIGI